MLVNEHLLLFISRLKQYVMPMTVHIFYTRMPDSLDRSILQRYCGLLSEAELLRYQSFRRASSAALFLASHALLRWSIAVVVGIPLPSVKLRYNTMGMIFLEGIGINTHVSLTHTNGLVACVLAPVCVGIDAENYSVPRDNFAGIAQRHFAQSELEDIQNMGKDRSYMRFCQHWVLKEAYLKGRGVGISAGISHIAVSRVASDNIQLVDYEEKQESAEWRHLLFDLPPCTLAVAYRACEGSLDVNIRRAFPSINMLFIDTPLQDFGSD